MNQAETFQKAGYDTGRRGQDRRVCAASTEGSRAVPSLEKGVSSGRVDETHGHKEPISICGFPTGQSCDF